MSVGTESIRPVRLFKDRDANLVIEWSDRQCRIYSAEELRQNCPCAGCVTGTAERAVLPVTVAQMSPVGNYAYRIAFGDGHETGIYPLDLLRRLGEERAQGC